MKTLSILINRNVKLFFKDKGMFFTALITPIILLVLYATFLGNVYKDSLMAGLPQGINIDEGIINGLVSGQLISSILSVSCVTVAFCSNFLMVQDKANGRIKDLLISPVKSSTLSIAYYVATIVSTLIICLTTVVACLIYAYIVGWYLSVGEVFGLFADVILLALFGTALSSVVNFFLSTQGQISAVGSIVSSCYGFICGAYMPISSFGVGLQKVISFLPGTYGTSVLRHHALNGALTELGKSVPNEVIVALRNTLDCNIYFFGDKVSSTVSYLILGVSTALLLGAYILLNVLKKKDK